MNTFINYAHRGASAYAPENTMSAFKKAFAIGANGIELDLQKTKDDKIVIFHDDRIDKKSNGTGKISDYTYNELLKLDFGSWFSTEYKNEKIVLFEDFMKEVSNRDLVLAIELKEENIEKQTLEIIKKYYDINSVYITSFMYNALLKIRKLDNFIKIGWLIEEDYYNYYSTKPIEGLETLPELFDRVHSFLDEIKIKYNNKNILLVTHGAVVRVIQFYFQEMPKDGMLLNVSGQKNCEIKEYEM